MANANLADGVSSPAGVVVGSAPALTIPAAVPADVLGNLQQSVAGPNAGLAYLGTAQFRDAFITAQVSGSVTTPAAGATIATVTPGTAGLWEVLVTASVLGTTVAAADSNNMQLMQTTTARLSPLALTVPGTTGAPFQSAYPPLILNLSAADTVNVKAIALATTGAVYAATIVCRRVG